MNQESIGIIRLEKSKVKSKSRMAFNEELPAVKVRFYHSDE